MPITFYIYVVFYRKRVFIRYLICLWEFAQHANTQDFVGPFTTSCEAQIRIVSKRRADTGIGRSAVRDWLSWVTDVTTLHGDWTGLRSFVLAVLLSTFILLFLTSSSVSLSNLYLAVPMRGCLGKHSCMSSSFPTAILNETCSLRALILFCGDVPAIETKLNKHWQKYTWYCEWANPIVSTRCCNWPNSNINVSLMWSLVSVIFIVPNQFYHMKSFKIIRRQPGPMFIAFWTTQFLQETIKIGPNSPMVKWSS